MSAVEELFDRVVANLPITSVEIDALLSDAHNETERLEYKAVAYFTSKRAEQKKAAGKSNPSSPGELLCKYVAGFANADGGVLVVGVSEATGQRKVVSGLDGAPWAADPLKWVGDCLVGIKSQLDPPPRFAVVKDHQGGHVLVVAVRRTRSLVACAERGALVYYVRMGTSTLAIPMSLVHDVATGRRAEPRLVPIDLSATCYSGETWYLNGRVLNDSILWASDFRIGVVSLGGTSSARLPREVAGNVIVHDGHAQHSIAGTTFHAAPRATAPFEEITYPWQATLRLGGLPIQRWQFALYVSAPEAAPRWYSVRVTEPVSSGRIPGHQLEVSPMVDQVELILE